jgi:hypothetical protein
VATTVARLEAILGADTRGFDSAMNKSESRMGKVGKVAGIAGLAIAGGLAVGLKKSVDAALESEKAEVRLSSAMDQVGVSAKQRAAANEAISATSRKAALDDEALSDVYAKLLRTTGDVTEAQKGMNLAADIARARNISLEAAAKGVERAYNGSAAGLSKFGVEIQKSTGNVDLLKAKIDEQKASMKGLEGAQLEAAKVQLDSLELGMKAAQQADKQATATNALDRATKQFTGTAEAYGKTSAGAQERFQVALENLQEKIGTAVLPILRDFISYLTTLLTWVEKNETMAKVIIGTLGGLAAALIAVSVATKAYEAAVKLASAAQVIWNAVMSANPIALVVIALAGLTAAVILAYTKSETFRKIVDQVWDSLKDLGGWITAQWPKIVEVITNPSVVAFFDGVWTVAKKVLDIYVEIATFMVKTWAAAVEVFVTAGLIRFLENVVDAVGDVSGAVKTLIEWIKDLVGWIKDAVSWIGKIKMPKFDLPDLNPFGDPKDPTFTGPVVGGAGGINLMGARPEMMPFAIAAQGLGLRVTSGLRPGAITANGTPSDHGIGKALDVAGPPNGMAAFFNSLLGNGSVKQAFYDPLGSIFGGRWNSYREGGHSDHVHVATYDKGGWLQPGLTLAYNGTGRPERVGNQAGMVVNVTVNGWVGNDMSLARKIRDSLQHLDLVNTGGRVLKANPTLT